MKQSLYGASGQAASGGSGAAQPGKGKGKQGQILGQDAPSVDRGGSFGKGKGGKGMVVGGGGSSSTPPPKRGSSARLDCGPSLLWL